MYSYHIVAELRQFRGVWVATGGRIHSGKTAARHASGGFADSPEQNPAIPA